VKDRPPAHTADALARWAGPDWDDQTRDAVRRRLEEVPGIRFFDAREVATLEAVVERIVPQPERPPAERVPIVPWIDEKLHLDVRDGYRYADLPPQREAWRTGLAGIDEAARALHGQPFAALDDERKDAVLRRVQEGDPPGASWARLPARRFFGHLLLLTIVKTYYAHPLAWREIGYGGPSSPRGHVRKGEGRRDPWEPPPR
jgi:hypothetical protein